MAVRGVHTKCYVLFFTGQEKSEFSQQKVQTFLPHSPLRLKGIVIAWVSGGHRAASGTLWMR